MPQVGKNPTAQILSPLPGLGQESPAWGHSMWSAGAGAGCRGKSRLAALKHELQQELGAWVSQGVPGKHWKELHLLELDSSPDSVGCSSGIAKTSGDSHHPTPGGLLLKKFSPWCP